MESDLAKGLCRRIRMIESARHHAPPAAPAPRPRLTWSRCAILLLLFPITLPLLLVAALRALLAPLPDPVPVSPEADPPEQDAPSTPPVEPSCVPATSPESVRRLLAIARPAIAPVPPEIALLSSLPVASVATDGGWALGWPSRFPGG
jgi:hypothetical protein